MSGCFRARCGPFHRRAAKGSTAGLFFLFTFFVFPAGFAAVRFGGSAATVRDVVGAFSFSLGFLAIDVLGARGFAARVVPSGRAGARLRASGFSPETSFG